MGEKHLVGCLCHLLNVFDVVGVLLMLFVVVALSNMREIIKQRCKDNQKTLKTNLKVESGKLKVKTND